MVPFRKNSLFQILLGIVEGGGAAVASSMLAFLVVEGFCLVVLGNDTVDRLTFSMLLLLTTVAIFFTLRTLACAVFAIGMFAIAVLNVLD